MKTKPLLPLETALRFPDMEIREIIGAAGFKSRDIQVEKARAAFGPNQYHATIYVDATEVVGAHTHRVSPGDKARVAAAEKALFDTFENGGDTEYFRDGNQGRYQLYIDADAFVSKS